MTWFKADDAFWRSRKIRRLGRDRVQAQALVACAGIWVLAGTWCADNLTDGFVPWDVLEDWDDAKHRLSERLIGVGLWDDAEHDGEHGIRYHDWADYNPLRVAVLAEREAAAERMRKIRESRKNRSGERSGEQPPHEQETFDDSSTSPTRPVLEPPFGGGSSSGGAPRGRKAPRTTANNNGHPPAATDARERAHIRAIAINACRLCDDDGYRGRTVCTHDPDLDDRSRRGVELVRSVQRGEPV